MSREKTENCVEQHLITDEEVAGLPVLHAQTDEVHKNTLAINQQFGLLPYNRDRAVTECALYLSNSVEAMFEAGKRLVQIKENESYGTFTQIIEENFGLDIRTAQVMMQASVKYLSPELAPKAHALALLGKTKLLTLMTQETEVLSELAEGGSVNGLVLDDIQRMTTRELQAALRQTRTDAAKAIETKESIITNKNKKIDELDEKLITIQNAKQNEPKPTPVFKPLGTDELAEVQAITQIIIGDIGADLRFAIDRFFRAFGEQSPSRAMHLGLAHCLGHIITTFDDVAEAYQIQPETELDHAAENPAKAEAEMLMTRMAAAQATPNTEPKAVGEAFADWEAEEGDFVQLFNE